MSDDLWPAESERDAQSNLPVRRVYRPEETAYRFHESRAEKRIIMGPVGSGKSVTCVQDILRMAREQEPSIDGTRSTRFLVARNTDITLKRTTIATWTQWARFGKMIMTPPIRWEYRGADPFGGSNPLDIIVYFVGLEGADAIEKLKSFEVTAVYLNEVDQLTRDIFDEASSRSGRWPDRKSCPTGPTQSGLIADSNAIDTDHWLYKMIEIEKPEDTELFRHPPAMLWNGYDWVINPKAENIDNLPKGAEYYKDMIKGKTKDWIRVYVCGEYGSARRDKPVYPEYDDAIHCSKSVLKLLRGLPLVMGMDFGLNPTAAFAQVMPHTGQVRFIDELISDGIGMEQFCRDMLRPLLSSTYAGIPLHVIGDPSGSSRSALDSTRSVFSVLERYGIKAKPSHMIHIEPRIEAVKRLLITPCYVHEDEVKNQRLFLMSPKCVFMRKGFIERYRYAKTNQSDSALYTTNIADDITTHVHDCVQYVAGDYGLKLNVKAAGGYGGGEQQRPRSTRKTYTYV